MLRYLLPLLALLPAIALADEAVFVTAPTPATRFVEADSKVVGEAEPGKRLDVLARDGDRVRVKLAPGSYGWLPASAVTDQAPAGAGGADTDE